MANVQHLKGPMQTEELENLEISDILRDTATDITTALENIKKRKGFEIRIDDLPSGVFKKALRDKSPASPEELLLQEECIKKRIDIVDIILKTALTKEERRIVEMVLEGKSMGDIEKILKKGGESVRIQMAKARNKILRALEEEVE